MDIAKINADIAKIEKGINSNVIAPEQKAALKKKLELLKDQIKQGAAVAEKKEEVQVEKATDAKKNLENIIATINKNLENTKVPEMAKGALKKKLKETEERLAAMKQEEAAAEQQRVADKKEVKEVVQEVQAAIEDVKKGAAPKKEGLKRTKNKIAKVAEQQVVRTKEAAKGEKKYKKVVDELTAFIKRNKNLRVVYKGASRDSLERDANRNAMAPGKRITTGERPGTTKGNVYYEYRRNRSDYGKRKRYPFFEEGGLVVPEETIQVSDEQLDAIEAAIIEQYGDTDKEIGEQALADLLSAKFPELDLHDSNIERGIYEGLEDRDWGIEYKNSGASSYNDAIEENYANEEDEDAPEEDDQEEVIEEIPVKAAGIENQYASKTASEVWGLWTEEQRAHFITDHIQELQSHVSLDRVDGLKERDFSELPFTVKSCVKKHIETGEYEKGGVTKELKSFEDTLLSYKFIKKADNEFKKEAGYVGHWIAKIKGDTLKLTKSNDKGMAPIKFKTPEELKKWLKETFPVNLEKGGATHKGEKAKKEAGKKSDGKAMEWRFTSQFLKMPAATMRGLKHTSKPSKEDIEKYKDKIIPGTKHRYIYEKV